MVMHMTNSTDQTPTTPAEWIALCGARKMDRSEVVAIADGTAARRIAAANPTPGRCADCGEAIECVVDCGAA